MEFNARNNQFFDYFFSWNGLLLIIAIAGLIYLCIRICHLVKDGKEEEKQSIEKDEKNYHQKHEDFIKEEINIFNEEVKEEEFFISPPPLTSQPVLLNQSDVFVSYEELYEKDCTIGEMVEEEEFEEMKENEIVIDVPINENEVAKENDNNEL